MAQGVRLKVFTVTKKGICVNINNLSHLMVLVPKISLMNGHFETSTSEDETTTESWVTSLAGIVFIL